MQANLAFQPDQIEFDIQTDLLRRFSADGMAVAEGLLRIGLSPDDLIYEQSREKIWTGRKATTLGSFDQNKDIPVVSFFTGCGGIDLGLEAIGFNHIAAFEFNELFCKTLRRNRPEWKVFGPPTHTGDVSDFTGIAEALSNHIQTPFEGLFVGGPPCQPFSIAANQRFSKDGDNFKRVGFDHARNGNLLFDYVRLISHFRPKVFLIENVPGLRDIDGGAQLSEAIQSLIVEGYTVTDPFVLNAADFGIAQHRNRLFVIGTRAAGNYCQPKMQAERVGAGAVLHQVPFGIINHEIRDHHPDSLIRYRQLNYGARDQLGRVDRLDPMKPSKTVIAGGLHGGGRSHLHPEIPRTLSVRECARLQSFPDDYIFVGPTARQFTQVGNAVPPVLAAQLGLSIANSLF
jgi:DNA (cytosine-5)-methyltransferase 1